MLQTERLHLRNLRPADADILFAYRNDDRCSRYQRYEATSMASLQRFVEDHAHSIWLSRQEEQHYAIVRSADDQMIGDLSVFCTEQDRCFTLGITVAPPYQRQGCAYELLQAAVAQLRQRYPSDDIVALIDPENRQSLSLFRKLGFVEECWAESIRSYVYTIFGSKG